MGRAIGGCVVENTGRTPGELAAGSVVGDLVVTLPTMRRVVVEAKNTARLTLHGPKGILRELDDALANRAADAAVCVSAVAAFPVEVGMFGIYGNRVLVVDDGEGTLLEAAVRVAALLAERTLATGRDAFDADALARRLANIRELANDLGASRRQLTDVSKSVEMVSVGLGTLRSTLLAMVDEAVADLARAPWPTCSTYRAAKWSEQAGRQTADGGRQPESRSNRVLGFGFWVLGLKPITQLKTHYRDFASTFAVACPSSASMPASSARSRAIRRSGSPRRLSISSARWALTPTR